MNILHWNDSIEEAFEAMKMTSKNALVLELRNFGETFVVETYALSETIKILFLQKNDNKL